MFSWALQSLLQPLQFISVFLKLSLLCHEYADHGGKEHCCYCCYQDTCKELKFVYHMLLFTASWAMTRLLVVPSNFTACMFENQPVGEKHFQPTLESPEDVWTTRGWDTVFQWPWASEYTFSSDWLLLPEIYQSGCLVCSGRHIFMSVRRTSKSCTWNQEIKQFSSSCFYWFGSVYEGGNTWVPAHFWSHPKICKDKRQIPSHVQQ